MFLNPCIFNLKEKKVERSYERFPQIFSILENLLNVAIQFFVILYKVTLRIFEIFIASAQITIDFLCSRYQR